MLSKSKTPEVTFSLLGILLATLSGCNNGQAIGNMIAPDPQLKSNIANTNLKEAKIEQIDNVAVVTNQAKTKNTENSAPRSEVDLPEDLPQSLPLYPQAKLTEIEPGLNAKQGTTVWRALASNEQVAAYYQQELEANNWEITQPFEFNRQQKVNQAIATKNNLQITVAISELSSAQKQNQEQQDTKLVLAYQSVAENADSTVTGEIDLSKVPNNEEIKSETVKTDTPDNPQSQPSPNAQLNRDRLSQEPIAPNTSESFTDLDEVPEQIRKYVRDVAALDVLTPYTKDGNTDLTKFAPNQPVTKGEYARWLIATNNKYYADTPGKKIYLADSASKSAFKDVKTSHPDFSAIQGLAEAGLVPSMLTDDSSKLLFQPDAPLKREDLIAWKVPLDTRKALPEASTEAIKESWGFQDTSNIDPSVFKAIFGDFQNGDRSNLQRVFGYTTLFQPKKPVTRAEAAASLWYFGFQGDGITAPEVLKSEE